MLSNRDAIVEVLDRLDAAADAAAGLSFDVLTTQELLRSDGAPGAGGS
jgi:hypothetical protein